jgi:tetratricopeptide (TPR) repeat protein
MKVRSVTFAFVSTVFFAALGATASSAFASTSSSNPIATQAYSALASGDSAKAVSLYTQAIESRSMAPELLANSLLNRALAYQQTDRHLQAIDDYTAALALDAMSGELRSTALYNRGLSQQKLGKLPLAIEDFTASLLLNPSFAHAFLSRGVALRESGQYLFALSDFDRALKFNHPDAARVYFNEAKTYELLKRPIDQKRMLEASLRANAAYAPALEKMAELDALTETPAQIANATDPVLTGSISAAGGNTLVHKPDLPQGVEPPAELQNATATETEPQVASVETPDLSNSTKKITDRVADVEEQTTEADPVVDEVAAAPEKPVVVASVPAIPPPAKKTVVKSVKPVASTELETVASISPAPISGWSVQIASASSESAAWTTWKNMQKRFKVLSDQSPVVMKADLGAKGIFYRVRIAGFEDQTGAQSACAKFKAKGVACFISKVNS